MKKLNFIGIGGATNVDLGENCAYLKEKDKLLLIDVCGEATKKLKDKGTFKGIKDIYIIITHTHFDHVAGLGVLIWYSNTYLNILPKIVYNDETYKKTLTKLLDITGVGTDTKRYEFVHESNLNFSFTVNMQPTIHVPYLQCFGIMFEDKDGKYYYTGDTNDFNYLKKLSDDPEVKTIYSEIEIESFDVHMSYDNILKLDKNKLILMHFGSMKVYEKAIKDGFNIASLD